MFSADELARMRIAQIDHMMDECVILSYTPGTLNEYNESDAPVETPSAPFPCGLDMRPGSERHGIDMTVIEYDATLRMQLSAPVKETDKVQIVSRFAEYPDALTFQIVSPVQRGPSGIRLLLRKVVV